jgi:type I restriction enzyme S subunit
MCLSEFCRIGSGGTPSRSNLTRYYEGGKTPWVKSGELRESVITKTEEHITEAALKETNARIVPAGALLLAMYGATVGRLGILGVDAATNQAVCHIIPDPKTADTRFLFQALSNQVPNIVARGVGGAQPNISQGIIKDLKLALPPLPEQRRIAEVLDKAEALRAKRRAALAQLDSLTQSLFLDLFGDPATNPKGWPKTTLGEIIKFVGGSQPPRETFTYEPSPDTIRLVQIRDFRTDAFKTYIPKNLARRFFEADDVMIGRYGPPVFQILRGLSGSYNVALMKALPRGEVLKDFIFHLLQEEQLHSFVVARSERTAGQSGVNLELLEKYPAYLPPLDLQREFARRVTAVEKLKFAQRLSLADLDTLFFSLQQRAFSGNL